MGFHTCNCIYLVFDPTTFYQEHNDYELLVEPYLNPQPFSFQPRALSTTPNSVLLTLLFKHKLLKLWGVRKYF